MRWAVAVAGGLACILSASGALACSVTRDFVRETNYELVEGADAVVVAVAESEMGEGDDEPGGVMFRIDVTLKGAPPAHAPMGWARLGPTVPSDPDRIDEAHPESFMGPCSRMTFEKGRPYVLFLKQGDGVNSPAGWYAEPSTFARSSEDYAGPDSLWIRAIRTYLDVQRNPDRMEALADLGALLPALEGEDASAADRKLAADIRDHLSSLSPSKPTGYLLEAYEALERGESPRHSIRGPAANREGGFADAVTDLIFDVRHPEFDVERQKESVLRSLANGHHPDAAPLFERLVAEKPGAGTLGMAIRFLSNSGQVRRAFELAETEGMRRLAVLPAEEASLLVGDISAAMRGRDSVYGADDEAWRSDPHVAARWPEMAIGLFWMDRRMGWGGYSFREGIEALRPANYRDRPEVTIALVSDHDEAARDWAIGEAYRLVPAADWLKLDDPAWLPLRALVMGFGQERDAALLRAWCSGASGRIMVVQTLGLWGDDMDDGMLERMLVTPGQDEEALDGVRKALAQIYGRHATDRRGLFRNDGAYETIKASLTGAEITNYSGPVPPIDCAAP